MKPPTQPPASCCESDSKSTLDSKAGVEGDSSAPVYRFTELADGARIICIEHQGAVYQLRCTRAGKLVLNK